MRTLTIAACLLGLCLASGCGGSGGGGTGGGAPPTSSGALLGVRSVPGYDLSVYREAGDAAAHLAIDVSGPIMPVSVVAWLGGDDYDPTAPGSPAERGADGRWRVILPLPAGSAPWCAWVRIVDAEGGILEAGRDFRP